MKTLCILFLILISSSNTFNLKNSVVDNKNSKSKVNSLRSQTEIKRNNFNAAFPNPVEYDKIVAVKIIDPLYVSQKNDLLKYFNNLLQENGEVVSKVDEIKKPFKLLNTSVKDKEGISDTFFNHDLQQIAVEKVIKNPNLEDVSMTTTYNKDGSKTFTQGKNLTK